MSADSFRWTPAQLRGVTNTSRSTNSRVEPDHSGQQADIETACYGEQDWTLPGMENRPNSCGRYYPEQFCSTCGEPHFGVSCCQNRGCPECWWSWTATRSTAICRRLGAARFAADDDLDKRAVHAFVSPPDGEINSKRDFYEGIKHAYSLAKEAGIRGGCLIPHGYRLTKEAIEEFRALDFNGGAWQWVRECDTHWRSLVRWSPHFHIMGLARSVEPDNVENLDGWIVSRIDRAAGQSSFAPFYLTRAEGYEDMIGCARYLLSHATYEIGEGKQIVRWFGSLAPAAFSPEEELSDGSLATIERKAEELTGVDSSKDDAVASDDDDLCERDGCFGELVPIWDAGQALMRKSFCEEIGQEQQRRLVAAFEWAIGETIPPPGLKHPRTEDGAREALEVLAQ